jgi:large subunit ribosomal protein L17
MRHKNAGRKFDRNSSARRAMFRTLAANLVRDERIETTDAKAKELRRVAERLITKAKRLGEVSYTAHDKLSPKDQARRLAVARLLGAYLPRFSTRIEQGGGEKQIDLIEKVMIDLAKRYAKRPGGYTRIVKFGPRRGDGAPVALIELMPADAAPEGESEDKPKKKKKAAKAAE